MTHGAFWAEKSASVQRNFSAVDEVIASVHKTQENCKTKADFYQCLART